MNDLDTVRSLRAHFASGDETRLAPGRARLLAAIGQRPRSSRARRVILPAAAAVVVATGAAVAMSVGGESATHAGRPARHATLTAQLLERASATAARRHVRTPSPRQWFYISYVDYSYGQHPAITRDPEWNTFDGRSSAYYGNGRLILHQSRGDGGTGGPTALDKFKRQRHAADCLYRARVPAR